jgi:L-ascorbate metabolism protein UlaG (beta-lactamase superfamily)
MTRYDATALLCLLLLAGCRPSTREGPLEVTYLANEGFMIVMGRTKVLIDPLPHSQYYANPSDSLAAQIENGVPPFDNIDYVLVTHDHPDHFNAERMSRFLLNHPDARFIASTETCGKLPGDRLPASQLEAVRLGRGGQQTFTGGKADITALRLDHGGYQEIANLAFRVAANGYTIMHVGDARLCDNREFLQSLQWPRSGVDLLFVEYFDDDSNTQAVLDSLIRPGYLVLMHIPPGEEDTVRHSPDKIHPRTVVFGKENETRRFDEL